MSIISAKSGSELVQIAKAVVSAAFENKNLALSIDAKAKYHAKLGVFVNIYKNNELRGSFGYTPGIYSLADGIKRAARGAAFKDPRFTPVVKTELLKLRFEVVIINKMNLLKVSVPSDYFKRINPRKHGLFIKYGPFQALQLPQFSKRRNLSSRDYLEKTIEKSALAPELWQSPNLQVFVFFPKSFSD